MKTSSSRGADLRSLLGILSIVVVPLGLWSAGCGQQREGERCDHKNGNDDCNTGLICKQSKDLGGNADICCPPGTSQNPECIPGGGTSATSTGTDMTSSTSDTSSSSSTSSSTSTTSSTTSTTSSTTSSTSSSTSSSSSSGAGGGSGS